MISIRNLTKQFPDVTPFQDVNLEIEKGEVISIIGPSGTGKSTLLRCLNLLEAPTNGEIWVDGKNITTKGVDVPAIRKKMGMVFQSFNLFSHLTVIENIMLAPVDLLKIPRQAAYDEGLHLLETVGLSEKALAYPDELSGGQKQRVAIARAMAMHPEIILFDEPTSALDPTMVGEVLSVIRSLARDGLTMMIVTHEMKFAEDVSTRVLYMDQGGIYEDGPPAQVFGSPHRERTRAFVRRLKSLELEIAAPSFDFIAASTAIESFGRKLLLAQRQINNLQLIFEELCVQTLLHREKSVFPVHFSASVSELDSSCEAAISYGGPPFNPFVELEEDLSIMLVANMIKTQNWKDVEDGNLLSLTL